MALDTSERGYELLDHTLEAWKRFVMVLERGLSDVGIALQKYLVNEEDEKRWHSSQVQIHFIAT